MIGQRAEGLLARLDAILAKGILSTQPTEIMQVLGGFSPDFLKYTLSGEESIPGKLTGKVITKILELTAQWFQAAADLSVYRDQLTPERLYSASHYAVVSLFPEVSFLVENTLNLCQEPCFEHIDFECEFKRYKAIRYTSISLVNSLRSRFLELSGFDSLVKVLQTSSIPSLQSHLCYLPLLSLRYMISPETSQNLYLQTRLAVAKITRFDTTSIQKSSLLQSLEEAVLKGFNDFPVRNFWKTVGNYVDLLLRSQESSLMTVSLRLYACLVESEVYRQSCRRELLSSQDALIRSYLTRKHAKKVTEICRNLITVQHISPKMVTCIVRGSSYLHLLSELITLSISTRYVQFLHLLSEEKFTLSKLTTGKENEYLDGLIVHGFPNSVIKALIPGSNDPQKIGICVKYSQWELVEHHSTNDLSTITDLFPRKHELLVYILMTRRRLKLLWVLEKQRFAVLPKGLRREISEYDGFLRGSRHI